MFYANYVSKNINDTLNLVNLTIVDLAFIKFSSSYHINTLQGHSTEFLTGPAKISERKPLQSREEPPRSSVASYIHVVIFKNAHSYKIKTHDSESRGQEEAGRTRDEQVSYLHVAPL